MNSFPGVSNSGIHSERSKKTIDYKDNTLIDHFKNNPVLRELDSEISDDFQTYIKWLDLPVYPNLVVLSSLHHYYYDEDDMKDVGILVNLKQLNQLKQIRHFLHSVYRLLPAKSYFIGCFHDNNSQNGFLPVSPKPHYSDRFNPVKLGVISENRVLNMVYNIIDFKTSRFLTKRNVVLQLEEAGLNVNDINEINGLTYFCAQKAGIPEN